MNMEGKRVFIVAKYTESMISSQLDEYTIRTTKRISIEEVKSFNKILYNSVKNCALRGTLRKLGIIGEKKEEFKAIQGDIIFSILVEGIDKKALREYSNYPELPRGYTLSISKHEILL